MIENRILFNQTKTTMSVPTLKLNGFFVLLLALFFASCEKNDLVNSDDINIDDTVIYEYNSSDPEHPQRPNCFNFVYPISVAFPDGSSESVDSGEELKATLRTWRMENPNATERPSFVYPLDVEFSDGETSTVENAQELADLRDDCDHPNGPNWYRNRRCFDLVFPVTLAFPDGSTAEAGSPMEMRQLLIDWRTNNPDASERPSFVFPLSVEFPNGDIVEAEDADALAELRDFCDHPSGPNWHRHRRCFQLVYPVTIEFPNGNTAQANNARQLKLILRAWRLTHPNATEHPSLVFPIQVELPNGNIMDIETPAQLRELREACERPCRPWDQYISHCFTLVYPITVVFPDSETAEADSPESLRQLIADWRMENPDSEERPTFEFPIQVELPNGNIVNVANAQMLAQLRQGCHSHCRPRPHHCFRFVYPLSIAFPGGDTVEVGNASEMKQAIRTWHQNNPDADERPSLVFPFDVELENGETATVENEEQFQSLVESCHP